MKQSVLDALHGIQLWGIVRSDTGGRCGRNDEFLAAFKRLEEEVSVIELENARLHEEIAQWERLAYMATNVHRENEKLRELVKDVQGFHECGKNCSTCPLFHECGKSFEDRGCSGYAIIHDRMRALGIEVE